MRIKEEKETPEERKARIQQKIERLRAGEPAEFAEDEITEVTAVTLDMLKRSSSDSVQQVEAALENVRKRRSSPPNGKNGHK